MSAVSVCNGKVSSVSIEPIKNIALLLQLLVFWCTITISYCQTKYFLSCNLFLVLEPAAFGWIAGNRIDFSIMYGYLKALFPNQ